MTAREVKGRDLKDGMLVCIPFRTSVRISGVHFGRKFAWFTPGDLPQTRVELDDPVLIEGDDAES